MAMWFCTHCDRPFDTNTQDHADYERDMCDNCVDIDREKELLISVIDAVSVANEVRNEN